MLTSAYFTHWSEPATADNCNAVLSQQEGANVGQAVNEAIRAIEKENPDLADVLPKSYHILESRTLASLLKTMAFIATTFPCSNYKAVQVFT